MQKHSHQAIVLHTPLPRWIVIPFSFAVSCASGVIIAFGGTSRADLPVRTASSTIAAEITRRELFAGSGIGVAVTTG